MVMFRHLLLASAAFALSGAALAADLTRPPPPPVYLPPPTPWTGVYLGLNAGGTWSSDNTVDVNSVGIPNPAFAAVVAGGSIEGALAGARGATANLPVSSGGFIGGGQLGYNYQFTSSFVTGIEADIQGIAGSNSRGSVFTVLPIVAFPLNFTDTSLSASKRVDYLGTLRGRLGFLAAPTFLIYGTAGLAYGGTNADTFWTQAVAGPTTVGTPYFSNGSVNDTHAGWTAGGGGEWMFLPNWSLKVEYLYYDLGSVTLSNGLARNVTARGPAAGQTFYSIATQSSTRFDGNIVRAGINYHFSWLPAPVVAKY
jgi:outer membrane immunogenic protein